ncbi:MAG: putative toxin-antitoxin system toxin component, PIN family [Limnochordales bacterium]|nr:putative toxin-antitoxin system toxin component, PIN family [Limnochordales bacterium]
MRAVLDTCVLIDAVFNGDRHCQDVLRQSGSTYQVLLSKDILTEYILIVIRFGIQGRVAGRSIVRVAEAMVQLLKGADFVCPKQHNMCTVDPGDNKFVDCAIDGDADFIVTGDHHLTSIPGPILNSSGKTVQAVSAWQFLDTIKISGARGRRGG